MVRPIRDVEQIVDKTMDSFEVCGDLEFPPLPSKEISPLHNVQQTVGVCERGAKRCMC